MKNHILFILFLPFILFGKVHVIGSRHAGMCSNFITVLNHLRYCHRNNITPIVYWDSSSLYYSKEYNPDNSNNVWQYYWEPVSSEEYFPGIPLETGHNAPDGFAAVHSPHDFIEMQRDVNLRYDMNGIVNRYVRLNPTMQSKIDAFYEKHIAGRFTVGIHLRGTDKKTEIIPPSLKKIIARANKYTPCQFFVATDEQRLLDYAKKKLKGHVVHIDCFRSTSNTPIHYSWEQDRGLSGEEIIMDTYLLARCHKLIHTGSNVGFAVMFLNPNIDSILIYRKDLWKHIKDFF